MGYTKKIIGIMGVLVTLCGCASSYKSVDCEDATERKYLREDLMQLVVENSRWEEETEVTTEAPTELQTEAPTEPPTEPPTEAPTEPPTEPPTEAPTEPPTVAPTAAPTAPPPTEAPTAPAVQSGMGLFNDAQVNGIISNIENEYRRNICKYALYRVGYPYSQAYRNSGKYFDCSSLAYYACLSTGIDISYYGMTTAAGEAQKLHTLGRSISINNLQPGDLIFYSTAVNGRYMNINHVAIYVGDGMVVEAINQARGVVYQKLRTNSVVLVCSIL